MEKLEKLRNYFLSESETESREEEMMNRADMSTCLQANVESP